MNKGTLKKSLVLIITCFTVIASATAVAFADGQTVAVPSTTTTTNGSITIAPDSVLYPLKLMVESVQAALTFTPDGKAELLVSFANKRLAEADLMSVRNKQELILSVMQTYVKTINAANKKAQEASATQTTLDVKPILDSIQITEQSADNFVIKVTGTVPQNISEQLKIVVADQVKKTIVNQAAAAAKDEVKDANQQVNMAQKQLEIAKESGNDTLVKSAADALAAAQKSKDDASALKEQVKAYKKDVVSRINQQEAAAGIIDQQEVKVDENDKSDEHGDKSDKHKDKTDKLKKQLEKRQEIYDKQYQKLQDRLSNFQDNQKD
jgi:hypothetical protein